MAVSSQADLQPSSTSTPISFIDLRTQQARIRVQIEDAIKRVLDHGIYIMGPEIDELEAGLAALSGSKYAISCASGTDALLIIMMALGIGRGDAVICPAFTYTATPEVPALLGATPIFAEVCEGTFNLDPAGLPAALDAAVVAKLKPRAIIAVDLFGQPADYQAIDSFAETHGLSVISDTAQGFGASIGDRKTGTFGIAAATSFFPAKPLGCYGDGGAIFTDDHMLAETMRSIRLHGKGAEKYDAVRIGINGRLDTIQAAILIEKLKIFPDEIRSRQLIADRYSVGLADVVRVPRVPPGMTSVWAQYTLIIDGERRDAISRDLAAKNIPTQVYYPKAVHKQPAYQTAPVATGGVPIAERLPSDVLSLPMHPYLTENEQDLIIAALREAIAVT